MMLPPTIIIAIGEGKLLPRTRFGFAPVTNKVRKLNALERFLKSLYYSGAVLADESRSHDYDSKYTVYPDGRKVYWHRYT